MHDTGLVAVPSRFRRLGGLVRHLQGHGDRWPDRVTLTVADGALQVTATTGPLGCWSLSEVTATSVSTGPPTTFILELPDATHLLAAPATPATQALLALLD